MKKMLLASAFALFGTFAMANEKSESQLEKKFEIVVEKSIVSGAVRVTTILRNCNGEEIGRNTETIECDSCEGLTMITNNLSMCPPNTQEESAPGF